MNANIKESLVKEHAKLKLVRGRGTLMGHLASLRYLRELEEEMLRIRSLLDASWLEHGTDTRSFLKCLLHMDQAQQRLHRVIRKLKRKRG